MKAQSDRRQTMKTLMHNKINEYTSLEYPKWKRMGKVLKPEEINNNQPELSIALPNDTSGLKINRLTCTDSDLYDVYFDKFEKQIRAFEELSFGTGAKYVREGETSFNNGALIRIEEGSVVEEHVTLEYTMSQEANTLIEHNFIYVGEGASAHIVIKYVSNGPLGQDKTFYHNGVTKVYVEKGGQLKLSKVQLLGEEVIHIDNNVSIICDNGNVEFSSIDLGAGDIATNYYAYIDGENANNDTITAYLGDKEQRLDIGYDSVHKGIRSTSLIDCQGALLGAARKVFRGNLKFEKGAYKSAGKESEYVLLLDPRVHSDAIPALLCDEDDVSGEHAASAGQVNEEQLFYLMSRGFSLIEAKKLIIHGSFSRVIDLLPSAALQEQVEQVLERRLLSE